MSIIKKMINKRVNKLSLKAGRLYLENPKNPKIEKLYKEIEFLLAPKLTIKRIQIEKIDYKVLKLSIKAGKLVLEDPSNPQIEVLYEKVTKLLHERNDIVATQQASALNV